MGHIKIKLLNILACFIIITFFSLIISENCYAKNNYDISFESEPTYELVNTIKRGNEIIGKSYNINIPIHNNGPERTEELIVNMSDEEGFDLNQRIFIDPGETKVVIFEWSTMLLRNQQILINFFPVNSQIQKTSYNSGSTSLTIKIIDTNDDLTGTSTPGFEFVLALSAIILLSILYKRKK